MSAASSALPANERSPAVAPVRATLQSNFGGMGTFGLSASPRTTSNRTVARDGGLFPAPMSRDSSFASVVKAFPVEQLPSEPHTKKAGATRAVPAKAFAVFSDRSPDDKPFRIDQEDGLFSGDSSNFAAVRATPSAFFQPTDSGAMHREEMLQQVERTGERRAKPQRRQTKPKPRNPDNVFWTPPPGARAVCESARVGSFAIHVDGEVFMDNRPVMGCLPGAQMCQPKCRDPVQAARFGAPLRG